MKVLCLVIALTFLAADTSDSWGQSKQPTPPPAQSPQSSQTAKPNERGTEQAPVIIKILPTKESEEKAAADAHHENEKAENDRRLARFTELLFWATGALSVIALFQLFVFGWQGIQLKRTVSATEEATKLALQEFTATHRPKIVVFGMNVEVPGDINKERRVTFRYINTGDTDASVTIIESHIFRTNRHSPPADIAFVRHTPVTAPILVPSGNEGFAITPDTVDFISLVRSGDHGNPTVFCVGVIVYRDKNNIERRTGFCRRFDGESERWVKVEDEDYEYSY